MPDNKQDEQQRFWLLQRMRERYDEAETERLRVETEIRSCQDATQQEAPKEEEVKPKRAPRKKENA